MQKSTDEEDEEEDLTFKRSYPHERLGEEWPEERCRRCSRVAEGIALLTDSVLSIARGGYDNRVVQTPLRGRIYDELWRNCGKG